jgi:hypothetical protein
MTDRVVVTVQPVAVTRMVAAQMLGMSLSSFERFVQPDVRVIRRDRLRLIPVAELEAWARENAERVF